MSKKDKIGDDDRLVAQVAMSTLDLLERAIVGTPLPSDPLFVGWVVEARAAVRDVRERRANGEVPS